MGSTTKPEIVSPERLLDKVDDYILLDVRRFIEYKAGHIPNALPCSFAHFIKIWGVALLPADSEELARILSSLGVDMDRTIVVYDNFYGRHAARAVYTLELLGFSKLALLDRTFSEYVAGGYPVTRETPCYRPSNLPRLNYDETRLLTRERIAELVLKWDGSAAIVDSRDSADYMFGHIPHAINIPWHAIYASKGLFNLEAVRSSVEANRLTRSTTVICYCEEGTSSSLAMYAFRHAGLQNTHTYLASYPDWVSSLQNPVEKHVKQSLSSGR
ncbi:MAG: rhodanese-like domain-containing protein [Candidatus Caldarchaeum sp.]